MSRRARRYRRQPKPEVTKVLTRPRSYRDDLRKYARSHVEAESLRGGSTPPKTGLLWP